jgi:hypothetical protein
VSDRPTAVPEAGRDEPPEAGRGEAPEASHEADGGVAPSDRFELDRRTHLLACVALAAIVAASDLLIEPTVPVLVVLILAGAVAGFLRPDGIIAGGLIVGLAIPAVRLVASLTGIALASPTEPAGPLGALSLVVLVVPALFAAVIGGYARRTLDEERRRTR